MRRRIAAEAEIAWCAHQPKTKVVHPDAVHDDTRRQRILGVDDGARQFQPAAPIGVPFFVAAAKTGQEAWRRQRARIVGIATDEYMRGHGMRQIFNSHGAWGRAVIGGLRQQGVVANAN